MSLSADLIAAPRATIASMAIEASGLTKVFVSRAAMWSRERHTIALSDVSFNLKPSEILAVVGESGSGKTTLGRLIVGLEKPDAGWIRKGDKPLVDTVHRVFHLLKVEAIGVFAVSVAPRAHPQLEIDHSLGAAVVIKRKRGFGIASVHMTHGGEPTIVECFEIEVGVLLARA